MQGLEDDERFHRPHQPAGVVEAHGEEGRRAVRASTPDGSVHPAHQATAPIDVRRRLTPPTPPATCTRMKPPTAITSTTSR